MLSCLGRYSGCTGAAAQHNIKGLVSSELWFKNGSALALGLDLRLVPAAKFLP